MPELLGKKYTRADLMRRVGSLTQVAGIREYTYNSGRADGVRAVEVNTGPLRFELLPTRCLDVSFASYRGIPFGYISKSGVRHPAYFSPADPNSFGANFLAGVMTTCGLHSYGPPATVQGVQHQLHGEIANIAAEELMVREEWQGNDCTFTVAGTIKFSRFYAEDLVLRRVVTARLGESSFTVEDEIENRDFAPTPCLPLYHVQFGFPFLSELSRLISSPIVKTVPRNEEAARRVGNFAKFGPPLDGQDEYCFYHTFKPDAAGRATAAIFNPELGERGMGVYVRYDIASLPVFIQWKMLRSREYVCGLEPAAAPLDNRGEDILRASQLAPLEKRRYRLRIGVIEGEEECRRFTGAE